MFHEEGVRSHIIREFYLPEQKRLLEQHIYNKRLLFKEAFLIQDMNELCKVIESKHSVYTCGQEDLVMKNTYLSLDWLIDENLYYFMFNEEKVSSEFKGKLIAYLSKVYLLISSKKWCDDKVFQNVCSKNITEILTALKRLINFYNNQQQEFSSVFIENMQMFLNHIQQLELPQRQKDLHNTSVDNSFEVNKEAEKKEKLISPLASLHSLGEQDASVDNDSIACMKHHNTKLSSPVVQFIRSSQASSSRSSSIASQPLQEDCYMTLNEQKEELRRPLLDYIGLVAQRSTTHHLYSYGIKSTDENKKRKANELLRLIDDTENLLPIKNQIEEDINEIHSASSYLNPSSNSIFYNKLIALREKINTFVNSESIANNKSNHDDARSESSNTVKVNLTMSSS